MRSSETDRTVACPASLVQLNLSRPKSEKSQTASDWGDLVHHWKETGESDPDWASEKDIICFEKKLLLSGTLREHYWRPGDGEHEVTFALNLRTLEVQLYSTYVAGCWESSSPLDRDDWKRAFGADWLTGTIDWFHWGGEETIPWIDDLKTGHWPVDPRTAGQLRSYALLSWVLQGCSLDWECAVSVTTWERYPLDGRPHRKAHRLRGLDMMEHLDKLRNMIDSPEEVNPWAWDPTGRAWVPGDQCTFCPNRLEHAASSWMDHWKYRSYPACWAGMKQQITNEETE